jgi:hypothetical protein
MRRLYLSCLSAALMFLSFQATAQTCWCSFLTGPTAVQQTNKQVKISWSTNTESSTAKDFIIQRSFTGTFSDVVDIGYVSANPSASSHSYSFYDAYPCSTGVTEVYYRLKSVNIDNTARISPVDHVSLDGCPSGCSVVQTCRCALNTLTGPAAICSGSGTYEVTNASGPVTWSVSNTNIATITPVTSTKATLTKTGDGLVTVTAAISGCSNRDKEVILGIPPIEPPTFTNGIEQEGFFCTSHTGNQMDVLPQTGDLIGIGYDYRILSYPSLTVVYTGPTTYSGYAIPMGSGFTPGSYVIELKITTACGTSDWTGFDVEYVNCSFLRTAFNANISPNPASNVLYVTIDRESKEVKALSLNEKVTFALYGLNSTQVIRQWKFLNDQKQYKLNIPGVRPGRYALVITKGKYSRTMQVVVK